MDFPNRLAHDDLLDALAYIDQVSVADFAHTVELEDTPSVRGMINKVSYMVKVEG